MGRHVQLAGRSPRITAYQHATLIDSDEGQIRVIVTDISRDGFKLQADETLIAGECVRLRIPRYADVPVEIRWARGIEAGGVFLEPMRLPDSK